MKTLIKIIMLICLFALVSCTGAKYDKKILKDAHGNLYQLEHRMGDCYFIHKLPMSEIDSLIKK